MTPSSNQSPAPATTGNYLSVRPEWLALHREEVLEPGLPIIDAHHHFYDRPGWRYLNPEYVEDAGSGHRVIGSVYMQALTRYRVDGPEAFRPVGETEFVAATTPPAGTEGVRVAMGIVGHADLRRGADVRAVLEAHLEAGGSRFRGIRHLTTWDADASLVNPLTAAPRGLLLDATYRRGVAQLDELGLSYDAWLLSPQLPELLDLARAFPGLPIVINHCGGIAPHVKLEAGISTAFGCTLQGDVPEDEVIWLAARCIEAGADESGLSDTVGYANPAQVRRLFRRLRSEIGSHAGAAHMHNTRGLGLANCLAAYEEGVRTFDSSLGGLGGCPYAPGASGNVVTEDLVFMFEAMGVRTGIDIERLIAARAPLIAGLPGEPVYGMTPEAGLPKGFVPHRFQDGVSNV